MGQSQVQDLCDQTCSLGQEAYAFGLGAEEFWFRLDQIEIRLQELASIEEGYRFLQDAVRRHFDYGDPLQEWLSRI